MTITLGQVAPDFEQQTTHGIIRFHEWLGSSWGILFSHPQDFTPVCTTELGAVARLGPEWARRNTKVVGLSVDRLDRHEEWAEDISKTQGGIVEFPLIADKNAKVAKLYGMIHPESDPKLTVRAVYIIDPNKKVRLILNYPPSLGRNFDEILRALDGLQLTDQHRVVTPADWYQGDDVIIASSVTDDHAATLFPAGWRTVRPYLRIVRQPR